MVGGSGGGISGGRFTRDAVNRRNRGFPIEKILILPYIGVRAIYRKYSGYVPSEVHERAASEAALEEADTALCYGSGKTAENAIGSTTCPNCGREVNVTGGKISLTWRSPLVAPSPEAE